MTIDPLLAGIAAMDSAALAAAADAAEEALACHRDALTALAEGWRSETGSSATDLLHRQCAEATDIVAALRRAATELTLLNDGCVDPAGRTTADRSTADRPMAQATSEPVGNPVSGYAGAVPALPHDPPAVVPAEAAASAPWAAQAAAGPWVAAPTSSPLAPANVLPSGSVPALPDLGGALVGLVAQIAQTLGSYADIPGAGAVEGPAETPPSPIEPERLPPDPPVKASAVPASLPDSAVPKSAAPQPLPPNQIPVAPPPELLAAERPPDPAVPVEPAVPTEPTPPPVAAAAPQVPPSPVADVGASPAAAADAKTPCEIAADELAKVGE